MGDGIRIAIVRSLDGHTTVCGPHDGEVEDKMDQAMSWHLEAGHLPAQLLWAVVDLPAIPTIPELRAAADAGQFPRSLIEDMDR